MDLYNFVQLALMKIVTVSIIIIIIVIWVLIARLHYIFRNTICSYSLLGTTNLF